MTVTLTPLAPPNGQALAFLLEIDQARILLDCGCTDFVPSGVDHTTSDDQEREGKVDGIEAGRDANASQWAGYFEQLRLLAPTLSLVLLSHPLLLSLGLLPVLSCRYGLRCPVYATTPTKELGRRAVEEWTSARKAEQDPLGGRQPPTEGVEQPTALWEGWEVSVEEVRKAFKSVRSVRFLESVRLEGRLSNLVLTAHRAGHTLGGTIWTLRSPTLPFSTDSILYAPIFNHVRDRHLDNTALLLGSSGEGMRVAESMRRPGVLITGAERARINNVKRKERDERLFEMIVDTIKTGHSVLLPSDFSARLVELLVLLELKWASDSRQGRAINAPICLVSKLGREILDFVRSLTEWMGGNLSLEGEGRGEKGKGNPRDTVLRFRHVEIFPTIEALRSRYRANVPKVVIAAPASLAYGFSRRLLADFAEAQGNLIILTSEGEEGSLARQLFDVWNDRQKGDRKYGVGTVGEAEFIDQKMDLKMRKKVFLEGEELQQYLEDQRIAKEREAKRKAVLARSRRVAEADDESDSSDSDSELGEGEAGPDADGEGEGGDGENGQLEAESKPDRRTNDALSAPKKRKYDEFTDSQDATGALSFDIYVRDEAGKSTRKFRSLVQGRVRMFPFSERRRKVDVYGEVVDVQAWIRKSHVDEAKNDIRGPVSGATEEVVEKEPPEPPSKYVSETTSVHFVCRLFVVDMEGKTDRKALSSILTQVNPRKLVLVQGSDEDRSTLSSAILSVPNAVGDVLVPETGIATEINKESQSFSIRLGEGLVGNLRMSSIEGYQVAAVHGMVNFGDESSMPTLESGMLTAFSDSDRLSEKVETDVKPSETLPPLRPALFIGDLKLTDLRSRLGKMGIPSDFAGAGVLVCGPAPLDTLKAQTRNVVSKQSTADMALDEDDVVVANEIVAVTKAARGELVIEGPLGQTFYAVRKAVYDLHAATT